MNALLKALIGYSFMSKIFRSPLVVRGWVTLLIAMNMSSAFFLEYTEARIVLAVFLAGGMFMFMVDYKLGFVRLLGLGHSLWLIMLPWLYFRLEYLPQQELVRHWIVALIVINSISLVIDILDVFRYIRGDRQPLVN
jgi:hypothetical protein